MFDASLIPAPAKIKARMEARPKKTGAGPFEKLGLGKEACNVARRMGYDLPSPIQRRAIPAILSNAGDVLANARTGSGKTAAFLLPLIEKLQRHSTVVGVRGLVVLPTRELALQTGLVLRKMLKYTTEARTLRLCYLIGGMCMTKQFEHLSANPDVIICTPGRLVHHLLETEMRLTQVEYIVFDEGDLLFELGFDQDLDSILRAVASCVRKQVVVASATLPPQLLDFARAKLRNPQFVYLDAEQCLPSELELQLFFVRESDKTAALLYWLEQIMPEHSQCIVFCATAHHVAYLAEVLAARSGRRRGPLTCAQLAGQLTQAQRDAALADFVKHRARILLATDVAARGVDFDRLDFVVHYTFPASPKLFIHRAGRTARKGQKGVCTAFISREEFGYLMDLLLFAGRKLRLPAEAAAGESAAPVVGQGAERDLVEIAGLPDLDGSREAVARVLNTDASVQRLAQAMTNGEKAYMRHRQPVSKRGLQRAGEVLQLLGGSAALLSTCHSAAAHCLEAMRRVVETVAGQCKSDGSLFKDEPKADAVKAETAQTAASEQSECLTLEDLRAIRPAVTKSSGKGIAISAEIFDSASIAHCNREAIKRSASAALQESAGREAKAPKSAVAVEQSARVSKLRVSKAARRGRQSALAPPAAPEDFVLAPQSGDERAAMRAQGLALTNAAAVKQQAFGLLTDDVAALNSKKLRWNAVKKEFQKVEVNKLTGRIVRNDAGHKVLAVKKGLFDRWSKATHKTLQKIGEVEDERATAAFEQLREKRRAERFGSSEAPEEPLPLTPLENLTRNLGLVEKINRKMPLTASEQRRYRRLLKLQANPIVTTTDKAPNPQRRSATAKRNGKKGKAAASRVGARSRGAVKTRR